MVTSNGCSIFPPCWQAHGRSGDDGLDMDGIVAAGPCGPLAAHRAAVRRGAAWPRATKGMLGHAPPPATQTASRVALRAN